MTSWLDFRKFLQISCLPPEIAFLYLLSMLYQSEEKSSLLKFKSHHVSSLWNPWKLNLPNTHDKPLLILPLLTFFFISYQFFHSPQPTPTFFSSNTKQFVLSQKYSENMQSPQLLIPSPLASQDKSHFLRMQFTDCFFQKGTLRSLKRMSSHYSLSSSNL